MTFDIYFGLYVFSFILFIGMVLIYFKQKKKVELLEDDNRDSIERIKNLELQYAVLQTRYEDEIQASSAKLDVLQGAKDELSNEFKTLANKIFEDKSKQFSTTSTEQLELMLKPFREQITNFSTQTKEQFLTHSKETYLLKDELLRLKQMNSQLSNDAVNLTKALKGENKTQGNWGEIVLENILEQSGLRLGVEYELQATLKSQEGKSFRPDVIIHMPEQRDIIIDSKVSLVAYERFMSAETESEKLKALKEHILSIKGHVKDLSEKQYEKLEGVNSLDFVLLFMPIEGAFLLALEEDGEFFKNAYDKNILVVSPSTLLVTLRTIEHIWRTQHQEEHALKIANEAEAMYDKLVGFVSEMQKIGSYLDKAQDAYETSMNRLKTGRGNVIKRAENIVQLGVKPKKILSLASEENDL
ncbi:DNA recombination protein RmuC [hydrothermal vent metagenome]|uniref:DNA recombination protein RmuC n=1 Tax=hydrothermal vent metagenome TaxID=652676 RepID=A0A1W1C823_9ZZZZ